MVATNEKLESDAAAALARTATLQEQAQPETVDPRFLLLLLYYAQA